MSTIYTFVLLCTMQNNAEEEEEEKKKRRRRRGGKKKNNLFSFELGFQINNLVELGFLKIFYLMCLIFKKKKAKVRILVGIII
jgi:hypothetical protein